MKQRTPILVCLLLLSAIVTAQDPSVKDFEAPKKLPSSEKEFKKSEATYIKAALWMETSPLDTNSTKRILMNAWTLAWASNCSYITVDINEPFLDIVDKNSHLMFVGIANYVKYCLENNYSNDKIKAYTAAIRSVINCYNIPGSQVNPDNDLNEAIKAEKDGRSEGGDEVSRSLSFD